MSAFISLIVFKVFIFNMCVSVMAVRFKAFKSFIVSDEFLLYFSQTGSGRFKV